MRYGINHSRCIINSFPESIHTHFGGGGVISYSKEGEDGENSKVK